MIQWGNIKNGPAGFESLALKYVEQEFQFPRGTWKATPETHDGNKDAYTVIVGYHPYADQDETWWMEAKYSTAEKRKYLTRFRLDATIVSSIFHKKVSKIVFVTNIEVHSKTISDIRVALQKAIGCNEVFFCTKQVIEHWLTHNVSIYAQYFDGPLPPCEENQFLFVSEDVSLYPYPSENCYIEECNYAYLGRVYQAYFKLISSEACKVSLSTAQKGIRVLEGRSFELVQGENPIRVLFKFTSKFRAYTSGKDGCEFRRLELFKINKTCAVMLKSPVEILESADCRLLIHSQTEAMTRLQNKVRNFQKKPAMLVNLLYGGSGTGKSYVVQQFIASKQMRTEHTFYHNFTNDPIENNIRLLDLVFFLLFPYVNPDEIDSAYLKEIAKTAEIPSALIRMADMKTQPDKLSAAFQKYCETRGNILPHRCAINSRYVFIDNIQNLSQTASDFLRRVLYEVSDKQCPIFFLLIGQNHVLDSSFYRGIRQVYGIEELNCQLETTDIVTNIKSLTSFDLSIYSEIIDNYFPNLIVLVEFLKYIQLNPSVQDITDFVTAYMTFINGGMSEALVLSQFENATGDETVKRLCFAVYTAPNGIALTSENRSEANVLLRCGIIKFNEQNRLIPFHDIYTDIYRRAYRISKRDAGIAYIDELDKLRDHFLFLVSPSDLACDVERITQLRKSGQFYSVCYILDSLFDMSASPALSGLKGSLKNAEIYYQLYFDYAYAATNCSHRRIGYDDFVKIYQEIKAKTSVKMRLLKMELLFELMNSNYNISLFQNAMRCYGEFQEVMGLLVRSGQLSSRRIDNEMFILCENMRILIQSARGKKRSELMFLRWRETLKTTPYLHYYIDFHIRYAHTLYTVDPMRALEYTEEGYNCLPEEGRGTSKLWCLAQFQLLYLTTIIHRNYSNLPELEAVAEASKKNYYSSYRHRNLALCAILYVIGDIDKADERLFSDMAHPRKLRAKLQGFYYETLALHYLAHKEDCKALNALNQAAVVFQKAPDYLRTIRHNQKVLKRGLFSHKRMDYNLGGALRRDWYYIDPRGD